MNFIYQQEVPPNKSVTYAAFVYNYRPSKQEPNRIRITAREDCIPYDNNVESLDSGLLEMKLILNSTILDVAKDVQFISIDIKDYFLTTPMSNPKYMRVKYYYILQNIQE